MKRGPIQFRADLGPKRTRLEHLLVLVGGGFVGIRQCFLGASSLPSRCSMYRHGSCLIAWCATEPQSTYIQQAQRR